jgi:hypothetical protein
MENLTIEQLQKKVSEPILIDVYYNSFSKEMDMKSIRYYPIQQEYRIFQYGKQVNESYEAQTAIKYYNELTF